MRIKLDFNKITEPIDIYSIQEQYQPTKDVFTEDEPMVLRLKEIIFSDVLTEPERRILLLYIHLQSQRKVGEVLSVSATTINKELTIIKTKIKSELKK